MNIARADRLSKEGPFTIAREVTGFKLSAIAATVDSNLLTLIEMYKNDYYGFFKLLEECKESLKNRKIR